MVDWGGRALTAGRAEGRVHSMFRRLHNGGHMLLTAAMAPTSKMKSPHLPKSLGSSLNGE